MFPRLRQQILARVDLVVEFSTLGEYGVDEHGDVMALEPCAEPLAARPARLRDRCGDPARPRQCPDVATGTGRGFPARP